MPASRMRLPEFSFQDLAREFSHFFQVGALTSSYKPVLFRAILTYLKPGRSVKVGGIFLIGVNQLAKFFFQFNFILYKKFHLKQLTNNARNVHIYRIIDKHYKDDPGIKKPTQIPADTIADIVQLLFRNVIYLLRKNAYFYEFYDESQQCIELPQEITSEQDFHAKLGDLGLTPASIYYIGIPVNVSQFIEAERPVLEAATLANLAIFLERLNTVPNMNAKIQLADDSHQGLRNIPLHVKNSLYAYQGNKCFYCGQDMGETPEADYFIPYNYLLDSPLWNIVGACEKCNGKKSNYFVGEDFLQKIQARNADPQFTTLFFSHLPDPQQFVTTYNVSLEQHYRNGLLYFKQLDAKFP